MAHWDYMDKKIHYYSARDLENGWLEIDCGCSEGLRWGGEYPRECNRCEGIGAIVWHKKSKVFALYPGGPFKGRGDLTEREHLGGEEL